MPSDYTSICKKNIEGYGKHDHHLSCFADLYSTRTHFIWELLQNTEDALSRRQDGSPKGYAHFDLLKDRLEVRHNGMPFVETESRKDVSGICGIGEGTKAGDYTQIGELGIGFKSVYAYTFSPRIHSGDEHFEIRRFVEPHGLNADDAPIMQKGETCIVLPFDSQQARPKWAPRNSLPAEQAVREIGNALRNLGVRSLLFLRQLTELEWSLPDGSSGNYLREVADETPSSRLVRVTDGDSVEEWQVYQREAVIQDGEKSCKIMVEVAFYLEKGKVRNANGTELVVNFPTEKKTGLGFLIQAPFKTTKARDNIKSDDSANRRIIEIAAQIAADSLETMRDNDLLDVSSYNALPLQYPGDSFFHPVYEKIRKALREKSLLPGHRGCFVKAEEAKLARGAELTELFSQEQLGELFSKQEAAWLDPSITESGPFAAFHTYLVGQKHPRPGEREIEPLIKGIQVDVESIASRLEPEFLAAQDITWLIRLIGYVEKNSRMFREKCVAIIRLQDGRQVNLPTDTGQPSAYFPPKDESQADLPAFPIVARPLASDKDVRAFLEKEGIGEIDEVAIVEQCILPKYKGGDHPLDEHLRDVEKIARAYKTVPPEKKRPLEKRLRETPFILAENPGGTDTSYRKSTEIYCSSDELRTYFSGNDTIAFVWSRYSRAILDIIKELGASDSIRVTCKSNPGSMDEVSLRYNSGYRRGVEGFDPDIKADGLENALLNPSTERSEIVWNKIAVKYSQCISGKVVTSSRQDFSPDASTYKEEKVTSNFGQLLVDTAWLPGSDGRMYKPSELTLDDLPESFVTDEKLADKLGMKKDVVSKLAKEADIPVDLIQSYKRNPREFQELMARIESQGQKPVFPVRASSNPRRRREQLAKQLGDAPNKKYEQRDRSVRTTRGAVDPGLWLRNQYTKEAGQMFCQICKKEMPFRKRDGEYYFEAVEALSKDHLSKEHEAQFLALCPLCAAMYEEFVKKDDEAMVDLKNALMNRDNYEVPLRLGELDTSIRFVETHYHGIKTILEEQDTKS